MQTKISKYSKSFLAIITILLIGFIIEFFSDAQGMKMPSFPTNLIVLVSFISYLVITYLVFKKTEVIEWFTSIPATIAVISAYTILTLIMGFVAQQPQDNFIDKIGFTHIKNSYAFVLVSLLFLMILGYTIIKRMTKKFNLKNIAFFLNHLGLFIVISAGSLGSGDMIRLSVPVHENDISDIAFDNNNKTYKLPFKIELNNFSLEQYPPELLIYNRKSGTPIIPNGDKLPFVEKGKKGKLNNLNFEILEYYPYAAPSDSTFLQSERFGTVHAALLRVSDEKKSIETWISTDNFMHKSEFLFFDQNYVIGMSNPKVLKYLSNVNIIQNNQVHLSNATIEVNKPIKHDGWKIYQNSYDSQQGRWSQTSIFEVIKDPWLPVVYIGIFMLIIGSAYLIYVGRQKNIIDEDEKSI